MPGEPDRLLPWPEVRDLTGLSRTTAWRMANKGEFPKPVRLSSNRVGWWLSELTSWSLHKTWRGGRRPCGKASTSGLDQNRCGLAAQKTVLTLAAATSIKRRPARRRPSRTIASADQIDFGF